MPLTSSCPRPPGVRRGRRLPRGFFARPTLAVARDLLGAHLVRRVAGAEVSARIVETEAYRGEDDLACHAARGRTRRNDPLYRAPGTLYVYFTYGMHWLLNVVTERAGYPAAVLIRAAEPLTGVDWVRARRPGRPDHRLLAGPARLTHGLDVDGRFNGRLAAGELFLAAGAPIADADVLVAPRIGVDYAGACAAYPWRFLVAGSPAVSRAWPAARSRASSRSRRAGPGKDGRRG